MGCGCNSPIVDFNTLENHEPKNPFDAIAYAAINGLVGQFERTSDFLTGGTAFVATPISLADSGNVTAWESDNLQYVGDAEMWSQKHKMVNVSNDVPPALQKLAFLRAGHRWQNNLAIDIGVDVDFILLSFLENAGTRGDAQGTVPVLRFDNGGSGFTSGQYPLVLTLKYGGDMSMGLKTTATGSGDEAMMEMDWVGVR